MRVPFSYLDRQFADVDNYLDDIKELVLSSDFTLGSALTEFEARFAKLCQAPHAVGVGSGTDAITFSLRALGIGHGDEVITTPTTFIATVGAITMSGATPVFVDSEDGFVIDPEHIESAITDKTKAVVPVHYSGNVADMDAIRAIAGSHGISIVEDACQAIAGQINGRSVGSWGHTAAFSLHPLKNLNVWGDGGIIVTHSDELAAQLRLLRNHGLTNRDEVEIFGGNSRLDTLHAVIGNRLIDQVDFITDQRIEHATRLDEALAELDPFVQVPTRRKGVKHVFHLYMIRVQRRDELLAYLNEREVEAKIHYPIPVHLQKAAEHLGYSKGDFPISESDSASIITLPAHQHLTVDEREYMLEQVAQFYQS